MAVVKLVRNVQLEKILEIIMLHGFIARVTDKVLPLKIAGASSEVHKIDIEESCHRL